MRQSWDTCLYHSLTLINHFLSLGAFLGIEPVIHARHLAFNQKTVNRCLMIVLAVFLSRKSL